MVQVQMCRGIRPNSLTARLRFGLPREIRGGFSGWLGRDRSPKACWGWQVPTMKIVVNACSGGYSASMPNHLLWKFAGFVWLAVENKGLAVYEH